MERRLNISTGLDPRWAPLCDHVRSHALWQLSDELQPTVHLRRKSRAGATFSCWTTHPQLGVNQLGTASAAAGTMSVKQMEQLTCSMLDHAYELALFVQAILAEIGEADPHGYLHDDDPSHQPWSVMVPAPLRMMLDQGLATVEGGNITLPCLGDNTNLNIDYRDNPRTHHEVELFEINTPQYRYFFGKSTHYLRINNLELPLTAQQSLHMKPLSEVVDVEFFHHPSLVISRAERVGSHLQLHLPHVLCPSARPPT